MKRKRLQAVIFGPQGSGKSTQARLVAKHFDVPFFSAGDLFRKEIAAKTSLGKIVEEYVHSGLLAPDEVSNAIILKQLRAVAGEKGFVLEGFPRNVEQAEQLDRLLDINLVVQLKLSDQEALKRLTGRRQCPKCGAIFHVDSAPPALGDKCQQCGRKLIKRDDDKKEVIERRLASYHFITEPLSTYYRRRGVLLAVKAEQPIPFLFEELVKKMAKLGFAT